MISRFITTYEVKDVVNFGEIIKYYISDKPYPSNLLLKFVNNRPLHVVVAQNSETKECIIVACYEPDANMWSSDYKEKTESL